MDTDDDISTLEEEEATISATTLAFSLGESSDGGPTDDVVNFESNTSRGEDGAVSFHVVSARTYSADSEKFVLYRVAVESDGGPAALERRYSEFLSLYTALRKSYTALMAPVVFPRKVLVGNFKTEVIAERSRAFELFLAYIYSRDVLKCSEPFITFLYKRDTQDINRHLLHSEFEEACPILENMYWLLAKLHDDREQVLRVLCQLVVCLHAVNNYELAYEYAKLALPRFESRLNDSIGTHLYIPFLHFCTRLWWTLGMDKHDFEKRLEELRKKGRRVDGVPGLLDLLRDEISLPSLHS
ncbi:sorting nexin 21 [Oratosquilla oratoria]|uniref:sorting nexin 21 n=1 Tax=Oratosquilla oratoria TaxID=337810 RepID=UPI003F75C775